MAKLYNDADPDKSDPKAEAEAEVVAKKNGFANLAEHNVVSMNIAMIMSGIDPETKKFTEPFELIEESEAGAAGIPGEPENASQRGRRQERPVGHAWGLWERRIRHGRKRIQHRLHRRGCAA